VKKISLILIVLVCYFSACTQEFDTSPTIGLLAGAMNYQGDLKPNSFTFQHSNLILSLILRKPLSRWFAVRAGATIGKVEAADRYNRDYLQRRNLSFASGIKELFTFLEADVLDISTKKFTPFAYGGIVLYHFDPYTLDANNNRVYLQPLSTEGQGLPGYPDRKVYKLTQFAAAFGGGLRFAFTDCTSIALEFSQRKTFTDYLDDVSTSYIDRNALLAAKGQLAVDLAYRGDEAHNPSPYPPDGEQRGTPSEMDWYYFMGISADIRINCLKEKLSGLFSLQKMSRARQYKRCPTMY
jgi:hypothetical protein